MKQLKGLRVAYFGDWVFFTGPRFIESPFETVTKDCQLRFLGEPVAAALREAGATVEAYSSWELYRMAMDDYRALLKRCHVLIVSDVEAHCFHLHSDFFDRSIYGKKTIVFPERLKLLTQAIEGGKGLMYLGGWLMFSGHMGKGAWGRSPIASWLPFTCLPGEDLVESSEGFGIEVADAAHPILRGLPLRRVPPLLGYNEFVPRDGAMKVLLRVAQTGHPLLGVSEHGKGRMATYGSDPVPHWGMNFMMWKGYADFWRNMVAWCAKQP